MLSLSETRYSHYSKSPLLVRFEQGDKTTLLVSEISVAPQSPQRLQDWSTTRIYEQETREIIDGFFSKPLPTHVEDGSDLGFDGPPHKPMDQAAEANRERVVFLARKYARFTSKEESSKEEEARLQILTERVRAMLPRVTERDFERVGAIVDELADIDQKHQALRAMMNLKRT